MSGGYLPARWVVMDSCQNPGGGQTLFCAPAWPIGHTAILRGMRALELDYRPPNSVMRAIGLVYGPDIPVSWRGK